MKQITLSAVALFLCVSAAFSQSGPSADEILQEACRIAGKEKKKVFIMFTASWCGWCKRMDKSMQDEDCKKYFDDNFIVRHFVVDEVPDKKSQETPGAPAIRTRYKGDGQGIPFWLIFDARGNLLADSMRPDGDSGAGQNTGCPASEPEVNYFIDVLKRTTSLKEDQLKKIEKRFLKNSL